MDDSGGGRPEMVTLFALEPQVVNDKQRALLAFICAGTSPEDPIRIMKGLFLFSKEGGVPQSMLYEFVPYSYGPCSFAIYDDLDYLVNEKAVERLMGSRWPRYVATERGKEMNSEFEKIHSEQAARLAEIRHWVDRHRFSDLLREVYTRFPDFATKSIFRG